MLNNPIVIAALASSFVIAPEIARVPAGAKPSRTPAAPQRVEPAYQETASRAPTLTALDYTEIQMLYGRSTIDFDTGADRGRAFARTFTPDGVFVAQDGAAVTGQQQLAALAAKNASCLQTWLTNLMIEPSAEGAIGWAYIWQIELACGSRSTAAEPGAKSPVKEGGIYRDVIVKTADGWRFKRRSYTPGHTVSKDEKLPA